MNNRQIKTRLTQIYLTKTYGTKTFGTKTFGTKTFGTKKNDQPGVVNPPTPCRTEAPGLHIGHSVIDWQRGGFWPFSAR